jgi:aarF domain-containing kinase
MAGRRLLDAALVLGATRNVARQHFRIRGEQLDVWSKTSTLARTLGLTRVRAVDLENQKAAQATAVFTQKTAETESIPRHETVEATEPAPAQEGLNQDHHYERSQQNTAKEPVKEEGLEIKQEEPENVPLPDGTLPPKDVPAGTPKAKPVNADVAQRRVDTEHKEQMITNDASSTAKGIKPASAIPDQDSVPEGVNTDVFHSPRVAKMLGGRTFDSAAKGSKNPYDRPGNPYKREAVKQEISPVRQAQPVEPVIAHSQSTAEASQVIQPPAETTQNDKELRDLAADLASDVTLTPEANAEVRFCSVTSLLRS